MAVDKLVDSAQLDADLTSVANAIRTKGGTSASLAFPAGFVSAVEAIPTGGGGETWITICDMTLTEDVQSIRLTTDASGNPFNLRKISILARFEAAAVKGSWMKILTTSNQYKWLLSTNSFSFSDSGKHTNFIAYYEFCGSFWSPAVYVGSNRTDNYCNDVGAGSIGGDAYPNTPTSTVSLLELYTNVAGFGAGSTIKIMGVSA